MSIAQMRELVHEIFSGDRKFERIVFVVDSVATAKYEISQLIDSRIDYAIVPFPEGYLVLYTTKQGAEEIVNKGLVRGISLDI